MLNIAQELGLSETAFITQTDSNRFSIRYFSPKMEIPLCGHATLASACIVFHTFDINAVEFVNNNGVQLECRRSGDRISMTFPKYLTSDATVSDEMLSALGLQRVEDVRFNDETNILILRISSTEVLAQLDPDYAALVKTHDTINGVLVTAPDTEGEYDYHLRYFWPWSGTNDFEQRFQYFADIAYWAQREVEARIEDVLRARITDRHRGVQGMGFGVDSAGVVGVDRVDQSHQSHASHDSGFSSEHAIASASGTWPPIWVPAPALVPAAIWVPASVWRIRVAGRDRR